MLYLVVVVMCTLYIQYSSCSKTDLVSAIDHNLAGSWWCLLALFTCAYCNMFILI